jgi:endonuclease/exonuclease/phosphatase family metal-dependent hydrolase
MFLIAILAGGGWYFTKGPGTGHFGEYVNSAKQALSQANGGQNAPAGNYPNYRAPQAAGQISMQPMPPGPAAVPTNYDVQSRPAVAPPTPMFGGPAIRIASFNIQVFGDEKAKYPGLMTTLASIIQNFHIVAIQEIRTKDDYFLDNFLRTYVNQNGRAYDKVIGPRLGRSNSKEQYAYLYDTAAIEVNRNSIYTVNDPDDLLHREPLVAMFRVRGPPQEQAFTFVLINIHTDPDETATELDALAQVYQVVRRSSRGEDDIILLGDLNVDNQHLGALGRLDGVRPLVTGVYTNTRQTAEYDNIVLHQTSTAEFSGRWGVFDMKRICNLTPQQALQVSDHLPVWAEFSAYESSAPGRVATREDATIRAQ